MELESLVCKQDVQEEPLKYADLLKEEGDSEEIAMF